MSLFININSNYKVIKIIDDMSIVLNCGENNGIKEKDRFYIYSNTKTTIIDPFSNESLGEFRAVKAKVEVTAVYERMCICKNAVKLGGIADLGDLAVASFTGKRLSLNVDPSQISGGLSPEVDEPIQIGDEVELIK